MSSLTIEQRRAVARRLFAALCAHYPGRYVALVEQPGPNPIALLSLIAAWLMSQPWPTIRFPNFPLANGRPLRSHLRATAVRC
jgi:hypothetical protein